MPDVIITPNSGIIDFFPATTRVGRIDGSGNNFTITNPSGHIFLSSSGLAINRSSPNAELHVYSAVSGDTLLNIEGTNGSLFSVVDNLSGSLMSVNNNAGLPVFEVFSDDRIIGGRFGQNDFVITSGGNIGIGTSTPSGKLQVNGLLIANSGSFTNLTVNNTGVSVSGHSHTISDITNFGSGVSGLLPTISNSGDNRVLTSTGSSVGINAESELTFDGTNLSSPRIILTQASADEGGEIQLAKAPNSSISGAVIIDTYQNRLRFFEQTGSNRGFYLDLSAGGAAASTNIGGGGGSTTVSNYADNRLITSDGTSTGLNAETNFTFNGSLLNVTGSGSFSNNVIASGFVRTGGTSSQFLKADGSVDSTNYQSSLTNPVTGTGIVNHIPYWNSSSGIVADSGQLIWDATNNRLGIGTSTPSGTLDVTGNTHTRGIAYFHMNDGITDTTSSIQRFSNNELRLTSLGNFIRLHGDAGKIIIQSTTVGTEIGGFGYIMFYPGLAEKARMTADGNFGIGTSAPSARLHVIGTGIFTGDVRTSGSFIASSGSAATPSFKFIDDADTGLFNPSGNVLALATSGVERLRIDNVGNVGIRTSSPSGQLHVLGTGIFSSGLAVNTTNFNFYTVQNDINTSVASISGSVWIQNDLNFYTPNETNQYQRGKITSNGDAIFNTLGVGEKLDAAGGSVTMDTDGLIVNNAGGTGGRACELISDYGAIIENTLIVNNNSAGSAKVGIGTSTPTHSLDVDGNIRCRDLYLESVSSPSIVSSGLTLNLSNSQLFTVNLNSNIATLTISNTPSTSGVAVGFSLIFTADGTARSVTWPGSIKWAGGSAPALTSTNTKRDVLSFVSTDNGTTWLGFVGGQNY